MSQDIRRCVPCGTFFFTLGLRDPRGDTLTAQVVLLRDVVRLCQKQAPFSVDAAVILPAGLHMIWTLPAGDKDFGSRWRMIKSTFARHLPAPVDRRANRCGTHLWARGVGEHLIRDAADLALHMHLIVTAPVRAGLVRRAGDWPFGSWHHQPRGPGAVRTIAPVPSSPNPATAVLAS